MMEVFRHKEIEEFRDNISPVRCSWLGTLRSVQRVARVYLLLSSALCLISAMNS